MKNPSISADFLPPLTVAAARSQKLAAVGITKKFGGLTALDNVSLDLARSTIHGLIGPNGSGKTSLLNMLSGYYVMDTGDVFCGGQNLSRVSVEDRVKHRIARTFQTPRLLGDLTSLDNVMSGAWSRTRSGFLASAFALPSARKEEREIRQHSEKLLKGLGLGELMNRRANTLEHGDQRFLEIGRALAMSPDYLLLDEPAGGLTDGEIAHLEEVIKVVRDAGIGVLLVEHHTDFVFRTCDEVTVLDLGKVIVHGKPAEVQNHEEVIRVYLGGTNASLAKN